MYIAQYLYTLIICAMTITYTLGFGYKTYTEAKRARCLNPPRTARRVESVIQICQEEVKNKLVREAYQIIKEQVSMMQQPPDVNQHIVDFTRGSVEFTPTQESNYNDSNYIYFDEQSKGQLERLLHHTRRLDVPYNGIYHPTLMPMEDKRIAGCLLHCVYEKNRAIDKRGWPTLDGLVDFYSEGVNEHGFFMATLRSANLCLRAVANKYHVDRKKLPQKGESCDVAFDVFDCIADQITGYCFDQYKY